MTKWNFWCRPLPRTRRRLWHWIAILIEAAALVAIWLGLPAPPPELWQRICHLWQIVKLSR